MERLDFKNSKILLIGDVMLDRYYYGDVTRISPEAPVPVVNVESEVFTLGGAGNVANNIAGLRAESFLIASAANDWSGRNLRKLLSDIGAKSYLIDTGRQTTTKLRVIGGKQQIVRLDFEDIKPFSQLEADSIKFKIAELLEWSDIIVISDYGKAVCSEELCPFIIKEAKKYGKKVIIDPKGSNWNKYCGASIITPNVKELSLIAGRNVANIDGEIILAGREIREKYNLEYLVVTRSEKGITIIADSYHKHMPTLAREVFDVSGAGDTVVATMAVSLASGYDIAAASEIANCAAGIVVGKAGTVPVSFDELAFSLSGLKRSKLVSIENIDNIIKDERKKGKRIIFTNGCFDILHKGHVTYLKKAKSFGDILILGLNSDGSVKRLKGESRPVNSELDRAEVLSALEVIDYITIFTDDTPYELIKLIAPDTLVKGGDYKAEDVIGREFSKEVKIVDFVDGYSTTKILKGEK